ncbi:hypothetical protein [Amycolatopsis sp. NPDC049868]|uniref:hypothetical protein n=1 Tax=Amycolatopsis sp. NPDC049868 TaxID=3363934 RepID=UPI0037AD8B75
MGATRRNHGEPAYVTALHWIGVVLVAGLGTVLLACGVTVVLGTADPQWYATGGRAAGVTGPTMALIALVFRLPGAVRRR